MFLHKGLKKWLVSVLSITLFAGCTDEIWTDHYYSAESQSSANLMELIDASPELSKFAAILHQTGYDKVLSSSQTYTVWAPDNEAMSEVIEADTIERFIKNHIARFNYSTSDLGLKSNLRIRMLNGKANAFLKSGEHFQFDDAILIKTDQVSKNGVLHVISKKIGFFPNLWESINETTGTDSIGKYLSAYDIKLFDASSSVEIGTSPQGIVYDSVFLFNNEWLSKYGRIHLEDSVYTMIVPDNAAWIEAYNRIKKYYKTYDKLLSETTTTKTFAKTGVRADSIQKTHTLQTIVQDLIFRGKLENIPGDSLVSTNKNIFYQPGYLFQNAQAVKASNGLIYKTSLLRHKPEESFHKKITVEAETNSGREFANSSLIVNSVTNDEFMNLISEKKYIQLNPSSTNPNFQPEITVEIPNTLAAKYDIYCVCVPAFEKDTAKVKDAISGNMRYTNDSTKISFYITGVGSDGIMKASTAISKDPVTGKNFETSPVKMTKFLIAKSYEFPFANFTSSAFSTESNKLNTVKIRVKTNVSNTEFTSGKYTRNLRVDSFILEPVNN